MEANGDCGFRKKRRHLVGYHGVGMLNAEDKEVCPIGYGLAVFAGAAGGGVLVCADDVLGAEIARTETVAAAEELRNFLEGDLGNSRGALNGFGQSGADVAPHRVVAREGRVSPLEDDDVLLA